MKCGQFVRKEPNQRRDRCSDELQKVLVMRVFRLKKKSVLFLAACVTTVWYVVSWLTSDLACSILESQLLLEQVCEAYHKGLIDGNLCPEICDKHTITFQKCLNYRDGKKILIVKWGKETVVIKSKKPRWTDFDPIEVAGIFPTMKDFMKMVTESIEFNLQIKAADYPKFAADDSTLLSRIWSAEGTPDLFTKTGSQINKHRHAMMRSVWTLIQQDEYITLAFLNGKVHIPGLLGTCGHFYAMEYLPPGRALEPKLLEMTGIKDSVPWRVRLKVALSLLEALKSYDEEFHETLHLCDVKTDNFGINSKGVVKILDLDTVFFDSRMKNELSTDVCWQHEDCDFFDCEGWCNTTQGRCTEYRVNNNLQVICKKLLSSHISNKYQNLLRGAPYDLGEQLEAFVSECIEGAPEKITTDPFSQHHAPVRLLDRIYNLLQKDLIQNAYRG